MVTLYRTVSQHSPHSTLASEIAGRGIQWTVDDTQIVASISPDLKACHHYLCQALRDRVSLCEWSTFLQALKHSIQWAVVFIWGQSCHVSEYYQHVWVVLSSWRSVLGIAFMIQGKLNCEEKWPVSFWQMLGSYVIELLWWPLCPGTPVYVHVIMSYDVRLL